MNFEFGPIKILSFWIENIFCFAGSINANCTATFSAERQEQPKNDKDISRHKRLRCFARLYKSFLRVGIDIDSNLLTVNFTLKSIPLNKLNIVGRKEHWKITLPLLSFNKITFWKTTRIVNGISNGISKSTLQLFNPRANFSTRLWRTKF